MESRFSAHADISQILEDKPEFLSGPDLSTTQDIKRKPAPIIDPSKDTIEFM